MGTCVSRVNTQSVVNKATLKHCKNQWNGQTEEMSLQDMVLEYKRIKELEKQKNQQVMKVKSDKQENKSSLAMVKSRTQDIKKGQNPVVLEYSLKNSKLQNKNLQNNQRRKLSPLELEIFERKSDASSNKHSLLNSKGRLCISPGNAQFNLFKLLHPDATHKKYQMTSENQVLPRLSRFKARDECVSFNSCKEGAFSSFLKECANVDSVNLSTKARNLGDSAVKSKRRSRALNPFF